MDRPPARLFCALSQNKEYNIVLRRGPSRQVAVFGWNRNNDTFQLGQWLKGKVYDHRLDISPEYRVNVVRSLILILYQYLCRSFGIALYFK